MIRSIGLSFLRDQKRREEEEEEEEKKKRREEERKSKKVWNSQVLYGIIWFVNCMDFHAIVWLVACPQT